MPVNYYINSTPETVNSTETWGEQDIDNINGPDMGITPLEMTIHPNEGYTVSASNFTIKGYEPTSTFTNGDGIQVREWLNGEDTTDAGGNAVSDIQVGGETFTYNVNKVQMYDVSDYNLTWPESLNPGDLIEAAGTGVNATLMINLDPPDILLDGSPIETYDRIGVFGEENGIYTCFGFIVWDNSSMPPAAITLIGDNGDGNFGFTQGQEIHIFILDASTNITHKTEVTWNTSNIPFAWTNGDDGFTDDGDYQILSTSNTTFPLISLDNTVKVKAWLDSGYEIGLQDTELNLDIDGDAQEINPVNANSTKLTVNMVNGEDSNCIVHVLARTGYSYTSGGYTIPAINPLFGSWLDVVSIPETGNSSSATIEIMLSETGLSDGSGNIETGPTSNSLNRLFYFIIEPLPGYSLHQGWVAPGIYIYNNQTFEGNTFPYDISTVVPWWETYETYLDSPFEPGFMIPDPIPSSPNGYWWPGFATQYYKYLYEEEETGLVALCGFFQPLNEVVQDIGFQPQYNASGVCEEYFQNYWQIKVDENTEWWAPLGANNYTALSQNRESIRIFNTVQGQFGTQWNNGNFTSVGGGLNDFSISDFGEPKNHVAIGLSKSLSGEYIYDYLGKEMVLNLLGGAQPIGQSMPTTSFVIPIIEDIN